MSLKSHATPSRWASVSIFLWSTPMSHYKLKNAYIVATGSYLPGNPISNDEMENYLGLVDGKPSRYRRRILQSNGIKESW